jgi:serine/threonine protein kinase
LCRDFTKTPLKGTIRGRRVKDSIQHIIQTQHPGIADELQGAINTLRKLQFIAGAVPAAHVRTDNDGNQATLVPAGDAEVATYLGDEPALQMGFDAPTLGAGESFGRYQIVRMLGKGAMGTVYLAYDGQLERHVALKQPMLTNETMVKRFYREARATAILRSPYICPIYDVGDINGMHFISMAFIEGRPLSSAIRTGFESPQQIATIIQKVALGLQKAHDEGIIHRDLKPDNIMLDTDGDPVIMDFGLARRVDDDVRLSKVGTLIGSPAYMSPEQVHGDQSKIGLSTDIYSLGVVLFEMLTGRIPFSGSLMSLLRDVANTPPPRPTELVPEMQDVPLFAELERHALKMMAKKPADRFAMAADVATAMDVVHLAQGKQKGSGWLKRIWPFRAAGSL